MLGTGLGILSPYFHITKESDGKCIKTTCHHEYSATGCAVHLILIVHYVCPKILSGVGVHLWHRIGIETSTYVLALLEAL